MSQLTLSIQGTETVFVPGQVLEGETQWVCNQPPKRAAARLIWYTEGKGTEDVELVKEFVFDNPQTSDQRRFSFTLPIGPYSFSGIMISLIWAVELLVDKECTREVITISPTGQEIQLHRANA